LNICTGGVGGDISGSGGYQYHNACGGGNDISRTGMVVVVVVLVVAVVVVVVTPYEGG
jgi:hypothetical protein